MKLRSGQDPSNPRSFPISTQLLPPVQARLNPLTASIGSSPDPRFTGPATRSPVARFLEPLDRLCQGSAHVRRQSLGLFGSGTRTHELVGYQFTGPEGGGQPIRLGLFAGIHGDEPAPSRALVRWLLNLERDPALATGYELLVVPVSNPTGFEAGTRESAAGRDLNREFWRRSFEPEVGLLEREIRRQAFDGILALHSDDTSDGLYGFVSGSTLTENLLRPALLAAGQVLPVNQGFLIDGFLSREGIIFNGYEGILGAPPEQQPRPFEIVLETPARAASFLQEQAVLVALGTVLDEYRRLTAFAMNL